jgi:hypothetical protein
MIARYFFYVLSGITFGIYNYINHIHTTILNIVLAILIVLLFGIGVAIRYGE